MLFSVTDFVQKRSGWSRVGSSVCYFRNNYVSNLANVAEAPLTKQKTGSKKGRVSSLRYALLHLFYF